jgi:hypothetical protein
MINSLALQTLLNGGIPSDALIVSRSLDFTKTDLPFLINDVLFVPDEATAVLIKITGKIQFSGGSPNINTINLTNGDNFSYDLNFTGGEDEVLVLGTNKFIASLFLQDLIFTGTQFTVNVLYF